MRTKFDIGQIIRCHGDEFLSKHQVVLPSEELSLTWRIAVPVPLAAM